MTLQQTDREFIYSQLTRQPLRNHNHEWLACMVSVWCIGNSILPDYLGLECHDFAALKKHYFADYPLPEHAPSGKQLDFSRMLERQDLINLLKQYSRPDRIETDWIIGLLVAGCLGNDHLWQDLINLLKQYSRPDRIETDWIIGLLVAGCLGNDHLWHDLGLWSRSQLTALLNYNFPDLAARNTHDMKWKKFLYKQLCEEEGIYLCRAPSCQVCVDWGQCYGSEETIIEAQTTQNNENTVPS